MKLHLPSVLVSIAVVGALALLTSQSQPATLNPAALRVEYMPHPRDMVQFKEDTPYTVPPGRILVITAIGDRNRIDGAVGSIKLRIDGDQKFVWRASDPPYTQGAAVSMTAVPTGLTAAAGSVVSVVDGGVEADDCWAWGYLASQ